MRGELVQCQQSLDKAISDLAHSQETLKAAETNLHQQALETSFLSAQMSAGKADIERLDRELAEYKEGKSVLNDRLEQLAALHHDVEKKHESAQITIRNSASRYDELQERFNVIEQRWQDETCKTEVLNEKLAQEGRRVEALDAQNKETAIQLQDHRDALREAMAKKEEQQCTIDQLHSEYAELKATLDERNASHAREVKNFEKQKESLSDHFRQLSSDILEAKAKSLQDTGKLTLGAAIAPFQQSMDSFKKEVRDIHHRETTQQGELRQELESLKELNQKITKEAHDLSLALRGQKKLQGNWGELILENVLERSGLQLGKDYEREVSIRTEDGRKRPDAIVYLPQRKHLIIDAKVSLNAYTRYVNADSDAEKAVALKEHVQAVSQRIKELADRDYDKLPGLNSPDIVFMFIPIESAFVEALKADESLFQRAIEDHVLVATPTTLLTSLNIIRQIWRYEHHNKHTAALAHKAESIFNKLRSFLNSFESLKKGLDTAVDAYGKAEGQLVNGRGNLVKQIADFKTLAPAIKTELPEYFTNKATLEIAPAVPDQ